MARSGPEGGEGIATPVVSGAPSHATPTGPPGAVPAGDQRIDVADLNAYYGSFEAVKG